MKRAQSVQRQTSSPTSEDSAAMISRLDNLRKKCWQRHLEDEEKKRIEDLEDSGEETNLKKIVYNMVQGLNDWYHFAKLAIRIRKQAKCDL